MGACVNCGAILEAGGTECVKCGRTTKKGVAQFIVYMAWLAGLIALMYVVMFTSRII